jgi:hypothetical protein
MLRYYFCGLVEKFYDGIAAMSDVTAVIPFDLRFSLFKLFEEWCGYGQRGSMMRDREAKMVVSLLEQIRDNRERNALTSAMEEQRKALEFASLKVMASLCKGPIASMDRSKLLTSFNSSSLFGWIESVLTAQDERLHTTAQSAIESLLLYNQKIPTIWEDILYSCFHGAVNVTATKRYFRALVQVSQSVESLPSYSKMFNLALFKLGDPDVEIRTKAFQLLNIVEKHYNKVFAKIDSVPAIQSPVLATFKRAQRDISDVLARERYDITHEIVCEMMARMQVVDAIGRRDILVYLLPWLDNLDLKLDEKFGLLSQLSIMCLNNLFFVSVKYGDVCEVEIEFIWQRLARSKENISAIIQFFVSYALERRNVLLYDHARKILVYLARTNEQVFLINSLLRELVPRSLVPSKRPKKNWFKDIDRTVYQISEIGELLYDEPHRPFISKGQFIMIILVDLVMECGRVFEPFLPLLVHVVFVHMDHYNEMIQEYSRSLLISLLQVFVKNDGEQESDLVMRLSSKEPLWRNDNQSSKSQTIEFPEELKKIAKEVVDLLLKEGQSIVQTWGEIAAIWSTLCPVRHIACRSLQIFRTINPSLTQKMLIEFFARLSNTIADSNEDVQSFALEIMSTLNFMVQQEICDKSLYPQLFWAAIACLNTCNSAELNEMIQLLDTILGSSDLNDLSVRDSFFVAMPKPLGETFHGIQPLVIRGVTCKTSETRTFSVLRHLCRIEADDLVDSTGKRWLMLILACLPPLMNHAERELKLDNIVFLLEKNGLAPFARMLESLGRQKYRSNEDFLRQFGLLLKNHYFNDYQVDIVLFILELLRNPLTIYRSSALKMVG